MPKLPGPPRDASGVPVEGFVRHLVWGVLFLGGSFALAIAGLRDHRGDWILMGAVPFALALLHFFLASWKRKRAKTLYRLGREVEHEIPRVTTLVRNGLAMGWVATVRLKDPPGREVQVTLSLNPQAVPLTVLVHDGLIGVYGEVEKTKMFRWRKMPADLPPS